MWTIEKKARLTSAAGPPKTQSHAIVSGGRLRAGTGSPARMMSHWARPEMAPANTSLSQTASNAVVIAPVVSDSEFFSQPSVLFFDVIADGVKEVYLLHPLIEVMGQFS